jgi:hypothetical protein
MVAFAFVIPLLIAGHAGYTHVGSAAGVDVYRQMASPLIDLRAEGAFHAPPEVVADVLLDYANAGALSPRVIESRVLSADERQLIVYQRLHLPVISDRDFTLRISHGVRGGERWIRFFADANRGPDERLGVVRVRLMNGSWDLFPTGDGRGTRGVYRVQLDLGGEIPRWMVSGGAARDLPVIFEAVRRQIRQRPRAAW